MRLPRLTRRRESQEERPVRERRRKAPYAAPLILPEYTGDPKRPRRVIARRVLMGFFLFFCFFWGLAYTFFAPYLLELFALPLLVLVCLVIWALPESRSPPVRPLEPLFFAFIVSLIVWPNYIAIAVPGLPWITVARLTSYPLVFFLMICLSTSKDFRSEIASTWRAAPIVRNFFVAFMILTIVSVAFSAQMAFSFQKLIVAQINWTAIFIVSTYVFTRAGRAERLVKWMWAAAIFVGLIGAAEWRVQHVLWAGHIPGFLKINDPAVQTILAGAKRFSGPYRVISTFSSPLGLGEYLALTLPFVVHFAFVGETRWLRTAARLSVPFILFVAWVSGSRLAIIGCLLGLAAYSGIWAFLRWRRDRGSLLAVSILVAYPVVTVMFALAIMFVGRLRHVVWGTGAQAYSDQARNGQITLGIPLILKHPWGYGIGRAAETLGFAPFGFLTIDNYYLSIALEYGVIGFIVFYGMFVAAVLYSSGRILADRYPDWETRLVTPAVIALVNFVIIKSVFSEEGNHPIVFMLLGMVVALLHRLKSMDVVARTVVSAPPAAILRPRPRVGPALPARSRI